MLSAPLLCQIRTWLEVASCWCYIVCVVSHCVSCCYVYLVTLYPVHHRKVSQFTSIKLLMFAAMRDNNFFSLFGSQITDWLNKGNGRQIRTNNPRKNKNLTLTPAAFCRMPSENKVRYVTKKQKTKKTLIRSARLFKIRDRNICEARLIFSEFQNSQKSLFLKFWWSVIFLLDRFNAAEKKERNSNSPSFLMWPFILPFTLFQSL